MNPTDVPEDAASAVLPLQLADRGARLLASLLDALLIASIVGPLQWSAGAFDNFPNVRQDFVALLGWSAVGLALTCLVQGYFWHTRAQSIGKMVLRIKIVTASGRNATLKRIVLGRVLPTLALTLIPILGRVFTVLDAVAIFRDDRRCLHDHIADTHVVRAGADA